MAIPLATDCSLFDGIIIISDLQKLTDCIEQGTIIGDTMNDMFGWFEDFLKDVIVGAVSAMMHVIGHLWLNIDSPPVGDSEGHAVGVVDFLQVHTAWIMVAVATVSVMIAGLRMVVIAHINTLGDLLRRLLTMAIVVGGSVGIVQLLLTAGDAFSEWIVKEAVGDSGFDKMMDDLILEPLGNFGGLMIVLIVGLILVLGSLIQLVLMLLRYGMLLVLMGMLPIAAAEMGGWLRRSLGWLAALILYKPLVAIMYAAGFMSLRVNNNDVTNIATGVTTMVLSVVALPVLLRLFAPPVGG